MQLRAWTPTRAARRTRRAGACAAAVASLCCCCYCWCFVFGLCFPFRCVDVDVWMCGCVDVRVFGCLKVCCGGVRRGGRVCGVVGKFLGVARLDVAIVSAFAPPQLIVSVFAPPQNLVSASAPLRPGCIPLSMICDELRVSLGCCCQPTSPPLPFPSVSPQSAPTRILPLIHPFLRSRNHTPRG